MKTNKFCTSFASRLSEHIPEAGTYDEIYNRTNNKLKRIVVSDNLSIYGWDGDSTLSFDREDMRDVRSRMHEGMHVWGYNDDEYIGVSRLSDGRGYYTNEAIANSLVSRSCPEIPATHRGIDKRVFSNIRTYKEITGISDILIRFQGLGKILESFRDNPRNFEASFDEKFASGFAADFITAMDNLGEFAETRNALKDQLGKSTNVFKTTMLNKLRAPLREMLAEHFEGTMGIVFHGYYAKQFEEARGDAEKTARLINEIKAYPDDLCRYVNLLKDGVSLKEVFIPPVSRGFLRATPENSPKDVQSFYDGILTPRKALFR